jgi:hypothetical protein
LLLGLEPNIRCKVGGGGKAQVRDNPCKLQYKEARRQPRFVATIEPVCEGANQAEREMRTMRLPENTSEALRILVNAIALSALR